MSQSEDVLKKMEALLKKHQGSNLSVAAAEEATALSGHSRHSLHDNPAIPTLTDIAVNATPHQRAHDPIPILNDPIAPRIAPDTALELDLDPYFISPPADPIAPEVAAPSLPLDMEIISAAPAPFENEIEAPLPDLEPVQTTEIYATPALEPVVELPRYEPPPSPPANPYATLSNPPKESAEQITDSFTEQVLRHLDKHLKRALETSITPQLANSLDKALSSMLDQFSLHIEHMVRETIARELNKQLESLRTNRPSNHSKQPNDPV